MKWSRLYPRKWRAEFGDEFDAMLEGQRLTGTSVLDIVFHAGLERARNAMTSLPFVVAWATICFLNIVAKEVQWPAGALLLFTGIATALRPKIGSVTRSCLPSLSRYRVCTSIRSQEYITNRSTKLRSHFCPHSLVR